MKNNTTRNKESGFALITALLILVLLTIIGIAAINSSKTELNIAANDKQQKFAFYAAEAGIETGRAVLNTLKDADVGFWDLILDQRTITFNGNTFNTCDPEGDANCDSEFTPLTEDVMLNAVIETLGPVDPNDGVTPIGLQVGQADDFATFSLLVRDNVDFDGNPQVDTDNTLILTSTATYGTAIATIETRIRYIGNDDYAQEHYKPSNPNQAGRAGDVAF